MNNSERSPAVQGTPFATDARITGLSRCGISIRLLDQQRGALCRSVFSNDVAEKLAHAILAIVHANRESSGDVAPTTSVPHINVNLMRHLTPTPGGQAATGYIHLPLERHRPTTANGGTA